MHIPKAIDAISWLYVLVVCLATICLSCVRPSTMATRSVQSAKLAGSANSKRVALLIGNANYSIVPLRNPVNDVRGMKDALEALNFQVIALSDGTRDGMQEAIKAFKEHLSETKGLGLFYFSGHGVQLHGENYLLPVDAVLQSAKDIAYKTVSVRQVLASMSEARQGVNIVLLDACRNNPFPSTVADGGRGLAETNAPNGTLLAYSTAPGTTASDGEGEYGVWTGALLQHIAAEGLIAEQVLNRSAGDVSLQTKGRQVPWLAHNLGGLDVYFNDQKKPANARLLLDAARAAFSARDHLSVAKDVAQALASRVEPLSEAEQDEARQLQADAKDKLAHLRLVVIPPSATVRIDGSGYSRNGDIELNPGKHDIEVSEEGYRSARRRLDLAPGSRDHLVLDLQRPLAWLPWTLGGVAFGSLVSSTITWSMSRKSEERLKAECGSDHECSDTIDWSSEQDRGRALAIAGDVMLGIGLAAAGSALLVRYAPRLFGTKETRKDRAALGLSCQPSGCSAAGSLRF